MMDTAFQEISRCFDISLYSRTAVNPAISIIIPIYAKIVH